METRIVTAALGDLVVASVYVPNGGKDYRGEGALPRPSSATGRAQLHADGTQLVLCGDLNIARTENDVHPRERQVR